MNRSLISLKILFFLLVVIAHFFATNGFAASPQTTKGLTAEERQVYLQNKPEPPPTFDIRPPVWEIEQGMMINMTGKLTDATGNPLVGVQVSLVGGEATVFSDTQGVFSFPLLLANNSVLHASHRDFVPRFFYPLPRDIQGDIPVLVMERAPATKADSAILIVEGDAFGYDSNAQVATAYGSVVASQPKSWERLKAKSISFNSATQMVNGSGGVEVSGGKDILQGERFLLNTTTLTGDIYNADLFLSEGNYRITASLIQKTGNESYRTVDAKITTCDGACPDWYIKAGKAGVTFDGYGYAQNAVLYANDIPLFYAPFLVFPAKKTRQTGLLAPHVSPANDRLGVDWELPLFVALSPSFDMTLYHRQMEKRGAKNGLEFRYAITENNYGTIYGDYFRDANVTGSADPLLGATDDKRWSLYYNHFSSFGDGAYLRADIARVSDRWYFRDLSAHNYYLTNKDTGDGDKFRKVSFSGDEALVALDATIRLVKNSERYSVTALLKYTEDLTQESNNASLQRYPEITASIIRQRFFASPLFFAMQNSLGYYYQYGGAGGGYAGDFNPTFSLPLQFDYFLFSPTVGAQLTAWHDKNNTAGTATDSRSVVKTGFFASTDLSRVYNFNLLGVEKIKHSVRPEVAYAYHEGYQEHSAYLPAYVSALPPQNLISLSLINEIIARETDANDKPHYRQFLYAKISQTFNVTEAQRDYGAAPQRPLGNLSLLMDFTPHRYFSFSLRDIFSTNEGIFLTENYEMRISDYRGDSAHVSYRYDWVGNIRELYYGVDFALNPSAKLSFNHRRDLLNNRDVGTGYSLAYKKDCWDFLVNYSKTTSLDAYGREYDDWSIKFLLNLRGLGGLSF